MHEFGVYMYHVYGMYVYRAYKTTFSFSDLLEGLMELSSCAHGYDLLHQKDIMQQPAKEKGT